MLTVTRLGDCVAGRLLPLPRTRFPAAGGCPIPFDPPFGITIGSCSVSGAGDVGGAASVPSVAASICINPMGADVPVAGTACAIAGIADAVVEMAPRIGFTRNAPRMNLRRLVPVHAFLSPGRKSVFGKTENRQLVVNSRKTNFCRKSKNKPKRANWAIRSHCPANSIHATLSTAKIFPPHQEEVVQPALFAAGEILLV